MYHELPPEDIVDLSVPLHFMRFRAACQEYANPSHYVDTLLSQQNRAVHMHNVLMPAANLLEREHEALFSDSDKKLTLAFKTGGVLAAAAVNISGAGFFLPKIRLPFPVTTLPHQLAPEVRAGRAQQLRGIGALGNNNAGMQNYHELLLELQDDLADPDHQPYVRLGFGLIMHLSSEAIKTYEREMSPLLNAIGKAATQTPEQLDAELRYMISDLQHGTE